MSQAYMANSNPSTLMITRAGGIPVVQSFAPSSIDMLSRTTDVINGMKTNAFDIMQFHNTVSDALRGGNLDNLTMANISNMMNVLPSDWKSKYTSDPSAMNDLLGNVNGLLQLAQVAWTTPPAQSVDGSTWTSSMTYNYANAQPQVHQQLGPASIASNADTYKMGMADHPDTLNAEKLLGLGAIGYKAYGVGSSGLALLGDSEAAAVAGESVLSTLGLAGETGLGLSAAAVGTATGVTELGIAAVGLAAVGYGIYKMAGGSGSSNFLDQSIASVGGSMDWFLDNIP